MKFLLALLLTSASAHMPDRPELNNWAKSLHSQGKMMCCDDSDTIPLMDPDWDADSNGHYRVKVEGKWYDVDPTAVVIDPNLYGQALLWGWWQLDATKPRTFHIRCFMPGAGG